MARTRSEDYEDKQRHILDSAAAVFSEMGMDKASMSQIAKRASVSKASLYHYYDSKSTLLFDIIHEHLLELDQALSAVEKDEVSAEDYLRSLIKALLEQYRDADDRHQIQLTSLNAVTDEHRAIIREVERRIVERFENTLLRINPALEGAKLTPMTLSLFGSLNWTYLWFRDDGAISREAYADMVASLMLNGLQGV